MRPRQDIELLMSAAKRDITQLCGLRQECDRLRQVTGFRANCRVDDMSDALS
jgi:hypothetical protein